MRPVWKPTDQQFKEIWTDGINLDLPGVYEFRVDGIGVYIGECTSFSRPRQQYWRKVRKVLLGLPHRKKLRDVHKLLARGIAEGAVITLTLVENVHEKPERKRRERELIDARIREAAHGGLPVYNSN